MTNLFHFLGYIPRTPHPTPQILAQSFSLLLFLTIARKWKQTKYPLTDPESIKLNNIYYLDVK